MKKPLVASAGCITFLWTVRLSNAGEPLPGHTRFSLHSLRRNDSSSSTVTRRRRKFEEEISGGKKKNRKHEPSSARRTLSQQGKRQQCTAQYRILSERDEKRPSDRVGPLRTCPLSYRRVLSARIPRVPS
jgi:hypothetical protein